MTQAVQGVNRVWLVFSGLAFLVCGLLVVARLSRSAAPPAAQMASPATGSVIHQQLSVPSSSAPPGAAPASADRAGRSERAPDPVEQVKPSGHFGKKLPEKKIVDRPRDGHGHTSPRAAAPPAKVAAGKPLTRGIEVDDPIPADSSRGSEAGSPPPPSEKDRQPRVSDTKSEHIKPKHVKAPPPPPPPNPNEDVVPAPSPAGSRADKLVEGVLKVNAPSSMLVGESEHIRAVIGTKAHSEAVANEASADVGEGPRVQLGRDMLLSPLVRMELRADVPGDFDITAFVPQAEQRLTDNETTVWDWAVQPKHEGQRGLTLIVTDLKETSREPIRTKTYPVHIEVHVATITKVHDLAVSISSVLSGLAGLIGAWMGLLRPVLQRRREGEAGMGVPRPAMSGAPPHPPHAPGSTGNTLRPEVAPPSTGSPPNH